jgi:uncharacterized membrane protein YeaQ/YmgE (transglycosylase-associated protein family)
MDLLLFILIGLAAGWLAGQLRRGRGFGLLGNLVIGVVGALIGGLLFDLVGLESTNIIGSLITATIGAIVLLFLVDWIKSR